MENSSLFDERTDGDFLNSEQIFRSPDISPLCYDELLMHDCSGEFLFGKSYCTRYKYDLFFDHAQFWYVSSDWFLQASSHIVDTPI